MNSFLFRRSSMERITSPEQLNDYIRVSSPSVWAILTAIFFLLAGVLVWGIFGALPTTIEASGIAQGSHLVCYLSTEDAAKVAPGMTVRLIGAGEGLVTEVDAVPLSAGEVSQNIDSDFLAQSLRLNEWNVAVVISPDAELTDGRVYELSIVADSTRPIDFLLG